ncbi:isocitrate lyase/phosphoenolpyruvate mutase family protein [Egicoccus sp. AB-alg2]|uniref:isocitrate lyase/PEP mutase family protein n=1 Tax=Egicoccus sp. AB-alg2 TaxID=3242693 RepID=UPI00359EA4AB
MRSVEDRRGMLRRLHEQGLFVLPNAFDVGSARLLASLGFRALATTSSGHAATLGRLDQQVQRDELLRHAAALADAVDVPLSVDAERCFAQDASGITRTVDLLADTGAAGFSLEDYDPATDRIDDREQAVERVAAAADAARRHGLVLTARAENLLYGVADLDDTIARLRAYHQAGADVVYAPGLTDLEQVRRVCAEVEAPVNVLLLPGGPPVDALAEAGVRRVSTGGALAWAAYGAVARAGRELLGTGTTGFLTDVLSLDDRGAAFGHG